MINQCKIPEDYLGEWVLKKSPGTDMPDPWRDLDSIELIIDNIEVFGIGTVSIISKKEKSTAVQNCDWGEVQNSLNIFFGEKGLRYLLSVEHTDDELHGVVDDTFEGNKNFGIIFKRQNKELSDPEV